MSTKIYPYVCDDQFDRMIGQFTRAFSGFQVTDRGKPNGLYRVPVVYGAMDRVTAAMINKHGYFKSNRSLPIMAVVNTGIDIDVDRKQSNRHIDNITTEIKVGSTESTQRIIGPPIKMNMEVSMMCSSKTELYQLLEQILLVFNPRLAVTLDDDKTNTDSVTEIELISLSPEISYPLSTEQSTTICTLSFSFSTRLTYPNGTLNNLILDVQSNVIASDELPEEIE